MLDAFRLLNEVVPGDGFPFVQLQLGFDIEIDVQEILEQVRRSVVANNLQVLVLGNELGDDLGVADLKPLAREYLEAFAIF